ncbi:MAG TPA: hypothetical protein VJB70_01430 [Candidatus Paceibacterota bacterium]
MQNTIEIIPAIIPQSWEEVKTKTEQIYGLVETVQIDITDGIFVPDKSWPYTFGEGGVFEKLLRGERGFPHWEDLNYEIDLMVTEPELVVQNWITAGAARVIVHIESTEHINDIVKSFGNDESGSFRSHELGVALNIATPNESVYPFIHQTDFIQCMGIEKIGYQGEPFSEKVIPKIKDLRKRFPEAIISVDGGVNETSAPKLIEAGANRLASGSAIWNAPDIKKAIKNLKNN